MNTGRSAILGWVALIAAAGGGYYIARTQLANERRGAINRNQNPLSWEDMKRDDPKLVVQRRSTGQGAGLSGGMKQQDPTVTPSANNSEDTPKDTSSPHVLPNTSLK